MERKAPNPPELAERAFLAMLPADRAETESGDLLEAYRDEIVPARGEAAADRWYFRQVALAFARDYGIWLGLAIAVFVTSDVVNTYRLMETHGGPIPLFVLVLAASLHGGWRSMKPGGGAVVGAVTAALLWLFMATWWMTTWYPSSLVQAIDPYWIHAWRSSAAKGETFTHWIFWDNVGATIISGFVLNAIGVAGGFAGGFGGAAARKLRSA